MISPALFDSIPQCFVVGYELPMKFRAARIDRIPVGDVRDVVTEYLTQGRAGRVRNGVAPLMLGPARTWKTYGACWLVNQMATLYTKFVGVPALKFRLEQDTFSPETKRYLYPLMNARFLVLDDVTVIGPADTRVLSWLDAIVCHRFSHGLPTLYTGNLEVPNAADLEEVLRGMYGPRIARRMVDNAQGFTLLL